MNIFTIPSSTAFIATLAKGLWNEAEGDPLRLSAMLVLLPNRRATRHLREAFWQVTGGTATLLPRLMPLGDVDESELYFTDPVQEFDIPPAIPELRRQMLLTQLVSQKDPTLPVAQASQLAAALADLLNQVQTEGLDFADLPSLVPAGELAAHWQDVLLFLEIITLAWPELLAKEGCIDPAIRRNLVLRAQAKAWRDQPPHFPIIAAGSTGSIPAVADLMVTIAGLPQGRVILPGLDQNLAADAWTAVDDSHPQFNLKNWLTKAGTDRAAVKIFGHDALRETPRVRLLNEAMRPAKVTEIWRSLTPEIMPHVAFAGLTVLELETQQEEAETIALRLRAVLEEPNKTAMLVTPDRALAVRVQAALQRWNIVVNDTAGTPLADVRVGSFLRDALQAASPDAGAIDYLALLKHPLAAAGLQPVQCRDYARQIEKKIWRGVRMANGMRVAAEQLHHEGSATADLAAWTDRLVACFAPIAESWHDKVDLITRIQQHIELVESLAAREDQSGAEILWQETAGEAAANWLHEWQQAAISLPPLTGNDYRQLFTTLARIVPVRADGGQHPRLGVYGLLEARLMQADVVICAGLNEGTWPPSPPLDPWMSRPMKHNFKLPAPERRVGLAAHDFVQLASSAEVILTRAKRVGTAPSVPSRFILQLQAVAKASGYIDALRPTADWVDWARQLDQPPADAMQPMQPPAPIPPLQARPRSLSVTEIGTLLRNPYAVYAKRILKLEPLDPIDADVSVAERGTMIHAALEKFVTQFNATWPSDPLAELLAIGSAEFAPFVNRPQIKAFWWPRFVTIAHWFIANEQQRRQQGYRCEAVEQTERHYFAVLDFTLRGRADRLDRKADGSLVVVDYKTGKVASNTEIIDGLEPQLPLLGLLLRYRGENNIGDLEHWRLSGSNEGGEIIAVKGDLSALLAATEKRFLDLVGFYQAADTAYRAVPNPALQPKYDDYRHLARLAEWGQATGDA